MAKVKNKFGQYMTPKMIVEFMVSLSSANNKSRILEPSCGDGIFLEVLKDKGFYNYIAFEIDRDIITDSKNVLNCSFISSKIDENFDLIIGNPPYIRWKNLEQELKDELNKNNLWNRYCNSLCDYSNIFIIKSIELLKDGGELIFITPEYWFNTTHSLKMRNYMLENGFFEEIYHFNETPIFENVTVSTIIFKYKKSKKIETKDIEIIKYKQNKKLTKDVITDLKLKKVSKKIDYFLTPQFKNNVNWVLASKEVLEELKIFENYCKKPNTENLFFSNDFYTIGDVCNIGNGMVSGLDKAFQIIDGKNLTEDEIYYSIDVVKAKSIQPYFHTDITRYIFINEKMKEEEFKTKCPNYYKQLKVYFEQLESRYKYNKDIKFWEWVFLRNYNLFSQKSSKIFVPCKERISHKDYFRFSYAEEGVFPTQDVTAIYKKKDVQESIFYILALLNSKYVFDWLRLKGIIKGNIVEFSEKPISSIPFRKIDFSDDYESNIHKKIVFLIQNYLGKKDKNILANIDKEIDKLFTKRGDRNVCELRGA